MAVRRKKAAVKKAKTTKKAKTPKGGVSSKGRSRVDFLKEKTKRAKRLVRGGDDAPPDNYLAVYKSAVYKIPSERTPWARINFRVIEGAATGEEHADSQISIPYFFPMDDDDRIATNAGFLKEHVSLLTGEDVEDMDVFEAIEFLKENKPGEDVVVQIAVAKSADGQYINAYFNSVFESPEEADTWLAEKRVDL